jgi:Sulfotransferase family
MGRSGSTLLNRMLGQFPGFTPVGEIGYVFDRGVLKNHKCGCGETFATCPFWAEVGMVAFGGWDRLDRDELRRLLSTVERARYVPMMVAPTPFRAFRRRLNRYVALLHAVYAAAQQVSGAEVLVDSTKEAATLHLLRHVPGLDVRVVQLLRDPCGVVYSWRKKVRRPEVADESSPAAYMPVWSTRLVVRRWLTANALVAFASRLGVPTIKVRYEDLIATPAAELARMTALLDLDLSPNAFAFLAGDDLLLPPTHTLAGNPMRFSSGRMVLRADEAWRSALPSGTRRFVNVATWPMRRYYGYPRPPGYLRPVDASMPTPGAVTEH